MKTPDIPEDEACRLSTLQSLSILDTPPEERFDRVTRMARKLFGVPIALVSLVDENRQWFKSCQGLNASETPRDISFCGHAILEDKPLIINDAKKDQRFADNPLVTGEPKIRFYAGYPLKMANGTRLGTLCIIDRRPGKLGQDELEAFEDLAHMVQAELVALQLATVDELTRISNRRGMVMMMQHILNLSERQGMPLTLVYLDLDDFKCINDRFGHDEGDQALVAFTECIKDVFRDSDLFARLGGDEFVVALTNTTRVRVNDIIERLQHSLDDYNRRKNRGYDISFSHGVVEYDSRIHKDIDSLLNGADTAMYEDKKAKKRACG
ncbi:MAG: sensor domain-containing diguanylate cyclase [Gammaproteobacteria bacterium]|nr:sensor domain-containing diguanylate cyclase [Gammaproteobacteria bacterium]